MRIKRISFTRPLRAGLAAPTGRTLYGGWGCLLSLIATQSAAFDVPSGQVVEFQESFLEEQDNGAIWARFRFVMPGLSDDTLGYADVADDFLHLCDVYAAPSLDLDAPPVQIVISLSDQPTDFGVPTPEARQFFEAFSLKNGACIWEQF